MDEILHLPQQEGEELRRTGIKEWLNVLNERIEERA